MSKIPRKPAQVIPPDAYPQPVRKAEIAGLAHALHSPETLARGKRAIGASTTVLRDAVLGYVGELEQAGTEHARAFALAHEIRGFAENAGLRATGRIADGLCRYFDEVTKLKQTPDAAIVTLHVGAIARAARAKDETSQMSVVVASELLALVNHKLAEIKNRDAAH